MTPARIAKQNAASISGNRSGVRKRTTVLLHDAENGEPLIDALSQRLQTGALQLQHPPGGNGKLAERPGDGLGEEER